MQLRVKCRKTRQVAYRHFPDFLTAYMDYARDYFCPDSFHLWTGLSIMAGSLERKVWLTRSDKNTYYCNLFVLLVGHPGQGKSTALNAGVKLLERVKIERDEKFNILPNQVTEAMFLELMQDGKTSFNYKDHVFWQCAGYYYASEASSELRNIFGDFLAALTNMYDCPQIWRKQIKGRPEPIILSNVCLNMLAGATFDYLKQLVNEESVMGGFASRLIYVIEKDKKLREPSWEPKTNKLISHEYMQKIQDDLVQIHNLSGPMSVTPGFAKAYSDWFASFDQSLIDLKSNRLQSLMTRKHTNLVKLCMLMSVSESDSLLIEKSHFDRALLMLEEVSKDVSEVVVSSIIADKSSQSGLNQLIMRKIGGVGASKAATDLKRAIVMNGNKLADIEATLTGLCSAGILTTSTINGKYSYTLLSDPDAYL